MGAKQQTQFGFTIIETVLFMSISALLAVLLLGGWSTMLNAQRYKDSVHSLQSFLQTQYNLVYNVENGRKNDISCKYSAGSYTITNGGGSGEERGQSECVLMGRYISMENGTKLKVASIIGHEDARVAANDITSFGYYGPQRIDLPVGLSNDEFEIPWGATISHSGSVKNYAIAILRSPLTGTVHTFVVVQTGAPPSVASMIDTNYEKNDVNLCIDPGTPLTGGGMGVVLKAYASSQSSVETLSEGACA